MVIKLINLLRRIFSKVAAPMVDSAVYRAKRRGIIIGAAAVAGLGLARAARSQPVYLVPSNPIINDFVPAVDDPTNASGLNAPAITRGTVYAHMCAGVTVGAGQSTGTRQATATGLQNAITYAATQGKFFEIVPNIYEINSSSGLVIPYNGFSSAGFRWIGASGTYINQFYNGGTGSPILTVGDTSGANYTSGAIIDGMTLNYGVAQTGLTSSNSLMIGNAFECEYKNISVQSSGQPAAYQNVVLQGGADVFSCKFTNFSCGQATQNKIYLAAAATGNTWDNIYLANGPGNIIGSPASAWNALAGSYINFANALSEQTFIRLNCEWGKCNQMVYSAGFPSMGIKFIGMHVEGVLLTGSFPIFFYTSGCQMNIDTIDFIDCVVQSGNLSGVAAVFSDYGAFTSSVQVNGFTWTNNFSETTEINTPISLFEVGGGVPSNDQSVFVVSNGYLRDAAGSVVGTNIFSANFNFDSHMPITASQFRGPLQWEHYSYGAMGSTVKKAVIAIAATYTHYGQYVDATILVAASVTGFTITLAATQGATGTQAVATGNTVHMRRESGSASGTVLVNDDAGTTLATSTTAAADYWFVFNGTHYVTFTPVT